VARCLLPACRGGGWGGGAGTRGRAGGAHDLKSLQEQSVALPQRTSLLPAPTHPVLPCLCWTPARVQTCPQCHCWQLGRGSQRRACTRTPIPARARWARRRLEGHKHAAHLWEVRC